MTIDWLHFTPWPALAGGALIGLAAALFVLLRVIYIVLYVANRASMPPCGSTTEASSVSWLSCGA